MPLVSAAITTFNRARFLPEAIESVLDQSIDDLELIVVDDGSTDDTAAVVEPYRDRVRYVRRSNGGRAEARNDAVRLAKGEFVAFCDSDDRWRRDRLERELEALGEKAEIGMVHGQVDLVDAGGRPLPERTRAHRKLFRSAHRHPVTYADYASSCRCLSSTILVRRDVFDEVGLYDSSLHTEDYDFYLRLLLAYDVLFLDGAPLAEYRVHEEQVPDYQLGMGQIETAEKHLALLEERDDVPDAQLARRNFYLMIARSWRALGDRRKARAAALSALKLGAPEAVRLTL